MSCLLEEIEGVDPGSLPAHHCHHSVVGALLCCDIDDDDKEYDADAMVVSTLDEPMNS